MRGWGWRTMGVKGQPGLHSESLPLIKTKEDWQLVQQLEALVALIKRTWVQSKWILSNHNTFGILVFWSGKFQKCIKVKLWLEYPVSSQTAHILKVRPPADGTVLGVARTLGTEAQLTGSHFLGQALGASCPSPTLVFLWFLPSMSLGSHQCGIPSHCRPRIKAVKD